MDGFRIFCVLADCVPCPPTSRSCTRFRPGFFSVALIAWLLCGPVASAAWDIRKVENRDYVLLQNMADFYRLQIRTSGGKSLRLVSSNRTITGEIGSRELLINGVKFILSHPIIEKNGEILFSRMDLSKLMDPVLRPSRIPGAGNFDTVVLDAGHGGHDRGARGIWGWEKDFNLDVARRVRTLLQNAGYRVVMTRDADFFVSLDERARIANRHRNAIFISIHFNSSKNREASGIETFVLAPRGVPSFAQDGPRVSDFVQCAGNSRDPENIALATAMHSAMLRRLRLPDRGVKRARFVVIREIEIPGVLLEGGFLSNTFDCRYIATTAFRQSMAQALADAVRTYQTAVSGGMPAIPSTQTAQSGASVTIRPMENDPPVVVVGTDGAKVQAN